MRFDDEGIFWVPETFKREKTGPRERAPKALPPIPETGWKPRAFFPDLSAARTIAFDIETFDPDLPKLGPGARRDGFIVGVSVAVDDFAAYYPVAHSMGENLDRAPVFAWLRDQLGREKQRKVGANVLYDLDFLSAAGVEVRGPIYDVQFADPLIFEYHGSYSLDSIARRILGESKETSLLYRWCADAYGGSEEEQRGNIWRAPSELVGPYAEQDAKLPLRIIRKQYEILRHMDALGVFEMECALIPLLLRMRQRGVPVSLAKCKEVDDELTEKIEEAKKAISVSVFAAEEIARLCEREGIAFPRTATGKPSFKKAWLAGHAHPKMQAIAEARKLYKLRDTFVRGALMGSQINGRIHCEFHPLRSDDYGTVSGRFSSSHPNLQQIPARDPYWGPRIRECFVPEDGLVWMKNDLSQIEFRLGVHFGRGSGIDEVREQYRSNRKTDFYSLAASMTGLPRQEAKSLSLGMLYGMGVPKFAAMIGKSEKEARQIFNQYNRRLPFMRATYRYYGELIESSASDNRKLREKVPGLSYDRPGFLTTIGGRVCHIDYGYEHKALNRMLQGSCADWIKRSMLTAYEDGVLDTLELYLTVHDELDSGVPRSAEGLEAARELHSIMVNAYPLNIPVLAGIDLGPAWGKLAEVEPEDFSLELLERS